MNHDFESNLIKDGFYKILHSKHNAFLIPRIRLTQRDNLRGGGGGGSPNIAKDTSALGTATSASSVTVNITIANNSNRILIVGVGSELTGAGSHAPDASSVKIGATNFTRLGTADAEQVQSISTAARSSIWYLKNPPTGAQTITVTFPTSGTAISVGALSLYNVDQVTSLQSGAGNIGVGGSHQVIITPTVVGSWVFAHIVSTAGALVDTDTNDWSATPFGEVDGQHKTNPTINSGNTMGWGSFSSELKA